MVAPRAFACSSDSNKRTPAPSPMTKPERSLSKGRDAYDVTPWEAVLNDAFQHPCSLGSILLACCGLSFPFEHIAFIAENPAYDNGVNGASAPPLSIISASPSPMAPATKSSRPPPIRAGTGRMRDYARRSGRRGLRSGAARYYWYPQ